MTKELDHERDVGIDPNGLDTEWLAQPGLFLKYSKMEAEQGRIVDRLKERLDVAEAEIRKQIISNPSEYAITTKPNLDEIKSLIVGDTTICAVRQELQDAQYELNIIKAAVRAIDQKKYALQDLVRLLLGGYFAGPQAPRDLAAEWNKQVENGVSTNIAKKRMKKHSRKER